MGEGPGWPSLYNPNLEFFSIAHSPPRQPGATYLYQYDDIFRFTFYWTLVFYTPIFVSCGALVFLNVSFPPKRTYEPFSSSEEYPLLFLRLRPMPRKMNERRSRVTFALIIFLAFLVMSVVGAVFEATIMSLVLFGLFSAGKYNMSTWVPFFSAALVVFVGLLNAWPSVIYII
ncbi:uncharacterized protein BT62DRAFT_953661 [Guyanagaster necrorhizus]|uniref:Transmembrane protein n=1 Tax=Guyanagaster necrorhizus TaxID=856835 RepID=A0A9P7VNN0_9AGAR|nr:uncharacterized protein BT62DRAFT_953661 [Guyanagaster necrorhizus MCA 3950]KAG7443216.1 hypothetical protein BT62DRAFT_953661 [Guyanagaster necrorhizus MCA 3950]